MMWLLDQGRLGPRALEEAKKEPPLEPRQAVPAVDMVTFPSPRTAQAKVTHRGQMGPSLSLLCVPPGLFSTLSSPAGRVSHLSLPRLHVALAPLDLCHTDCHEPQMCSFPGATTNWGEGHLKQQKETRDEKSEIKGSTCLPLRRILPCFLQPLVAAGFPGLWPRPMSVP